MTMTPCLMIFLAPESLAAVRNRGAVLARICRKKKIPLALICPGQDLADPALLENPGAYARAAAEHLNLTASHPPASQVLEGIDRALTLMCPGTVVLSAGAPTGALYGEVLTHIKARFPGIQVLTMAGDDPDPSWARRLEQRLQKGVPGPVAGLRETVGSVPAVWPENAENSVALAGMLGDLCGAVQPERGPLAFLFMAGDAGGALKNWLGPWLESKAADIFFGLQITAGQAGDLESELDHLWTKGLRLVHWITDAPEPPLPRALLWQVSKQGIWNHVSGADLFPEKDPEGTGAWIANNPNIVHSFESFGGSGAMAPALTGRGQAPAQQLSYGRVTPLPGKPFWHFLSGSRTILAALCHTGAKQLVRLRLDPKTGALAEMGTSVVYHYKKPGEMDGRTLDEIVAMVDAGGSVDLTHVRSNLEKAYLIAYAVEGGVIVGNSSLKHPRQAFIDRIRAITGLDFNRFVERGYTSVRPEYRAMGIGAQLLEGLTARATDVKVFSLISEDNLATQKIALRNNTRKIAVYYSDKVGKDMGIWMPAHMIDSQWEIDP